MTPTFDKQVIYQLSDEDIITELCKRVKAVRLSCCCSQQDFAEQCGVSIITIKRIESKKVKDITFNTLLKIMRFCGSLEGVVDLIPEMPASPFLINEKTGKSVQRVTNKRMDLV